MSFGFLFPFNGSLEGGVSSSGCSNPYFWDFYGSSLQKIVYDNGFARSAYNDCKYGFAADLSEDEMAANITSLSVEARFITRSYNLESWNDCGFRFDTVTGETLLIQVGSADGSQNRRAVWQIGGYSGETPVSGTTDFVLHISVSGGVATILVNGVFMASGQFDIGAVADYGWVPYVIMTLDGKMDYLNLSAATSFGQAEPFWTDFRGATESV